MRRALQQLTGLVAAAIGLAVWFGPALGDFGPAVAEARISGPTPIQHVVIIYQENHSFDNVLGKLCVLDDRCNGATTGKLPDGQVIPLRRASDIVEKVEHLSGGQRTAINDGKMDGFSKIGGCGPANDYQCYTQYHPSQVPNLSALARHFNISDRTFSMSPISSWGAHLELVAQTLDGFIQHVPQDIPRASPAKPSVPAGGATATRTSAGSRARPPRPSSCPAVFPTTASTRRSTRLAAPTRPRRSNTFQRSWTGWTRPALQLEDLRRPGDPAARRTAGRSARRSPSVFTPRSTTTWCRASR